MSIRNLGIYGTGRNTIRQWQINKSPPFKIKMNKITPSCLKFCLKIWISLFCTDQWLINLNPQNWLLNFNGSIIIFCPLLNPSFPFYWPNPVSISKENDFSYIKVTGSLGVTTEPTWFSFTMYLLTGLGKVYNNPTPGL